MPLLSGLRNLFAPRVITAPKPNGDLQSWAARVTEQVRQATLSGQLRWTPYIDNLTEETWQIRDEYRKMLREPAVKSSYLGKIYAVCSLDYQVHAENKEAELDRQAAEFATNLFRRVNGGMPKVLWTILGHAGIDGYSISEQVRELETHGRWKGKYVLRDLKAKDNMQVTVDEYRNVVGLECHAYGQVGIEFDVEDFVVYSHLSFFENPTGMSDFRAIYRAVWMKKQVWQFRGIHLEKWSGPFLKGTYPAGADDVRAALESALAAAKAQTWLTIPTGAAVDAVYAAASTTDYESAIKDLNEEILIGIEGAFLHGLGGQVPEGRGDTKEHRTRSELFQWMLSTQACECLNRQVIPWFIDRNFPAGTGYPRVTLGMVSERDMIPALEIDERLQKLGFKFSIKQTSEKYGRTYSTDPEDTLEPPTQGQPGGAGGFPFSENGVDKFCGGPGSGVPGPCPTGRKDGAKVGDASGARIKAEVLTKAAAVEFSDKIPLHMKDNMWVPGLGDSSVLRFSTASGSQYEVTFERETIGGIAAHNLVFADAKGKTEITGSGSAHEVFSKVISATTAYVLKHNPPIVAFSAAEPSRQRLYDRMAKGLTKIAPDYAAFYIDTGGQRQYIAVRREYREEATKFIKDRLKSNPQLLAEATDDEPIIVPLEPDLDPLWFDPEGWEDSDEFSEPNGPAEEQVALAGPDGTKAEQLLTRAKREGASILADVTKVAVRRLLRNGHEGATRLYSEEERGEIAEMLASTNATAHLLGRARILKRAEQAKKNRRNFTEKPTDFSIFRENLEPLTPERAVEYFRKLVPTLSVNGEAFANGMRREAFTLAAATDQTVLQKVKDVIAQRLATGEGVSTAPKAIDSILDSAGISPRNSQYSEMVTRTQMMDSYNAGSSQQLQEVAEDFPVFRYVGIRDGRQGSDHEPKFDKYYPSTADFAEVRGERPFNCRCTMIPIYKTDWAKLQKQGATVETSW